MTTAFDVILIGSGVSSLTSAAILSKRGLSVCVLEQYKKPGGYLHSFKRFGHTYETGAHYLGGLEPGQPFHTMLSYLGVYDPDLFIALDPTGFDVFQFPTFEYSFPKGYRAVISSLSDLFPHEAKNIAAYFQQVASTVDSFQSQTDSREANLSQVIASLEISLAEKVRPLVKDEKVRAVLYGHCYLHGVEPHDVSFGHHALIIDSIIQSAYGIRRSGDALAQKFVDVIQKAGGVLRLGVAVTRLHTHNNRVTEVELANGERLSANHVISGTHPKATFRMLDANCLAPALKQRLANLPESQSIFGIYSEVTAPPNFAPLKNYYYFATENSSDLMKFKDFSDEPSVVFACRSDRAAPPNTLKYPLTLHSPGPMRWFTQSDARPGDARPADYQEKKDIIAEQVLNFVDKRVPGLRQGITRFETSTGFTNLRFNGSEGGSGYGIYHAKQYTGLRALGPRTRVENLFLTGQSTMMPGILAAAKSGLRAAGEIIGMKEIMEEIRQVGRV